MQRWNAQTRIIVACAVLLAGLDIYVRFATAPKAVNSSVVTAQEFRLTDKQGNIRAVMKTDDEGEPGLRMYDKTGTLRLQLDSYETTPSLILMDQNGERRAYYGMSSPTGDGEISFMTPSGATTAAIRVNGGQSSLSLRDGSSYSSVTTSDSIGQTYQTEVRSIAR